MNLNFLKLHLRLLDKALKNPAGDIIKFEDTSCLNELVEPLTFCLFWGVFKGLNDIETVKKCIVIEMVVQNALKVYNLIFVALSNSQNLLIDWLRNWESLKQAKSSLSKIVYVQKLE